MLARLNQETYGFHSERVQTWGAFADRSGEIEGVLIRFRGTMIAIDSDGGCASAFAAEIDSQTDITGLRGPLEAMLGIQAALRRYAVTHFEESHYMRLTRPVCLPADQIERARQARSDDLDALARLYAGAGLMYRSRANIVEKLAESPVFVAESPSAAGTPARIVSCALLNLEGEEAGLIGGVYTDPSARGKGYATACTAALAHHLLEADRMPCLFYENSAAGRIYRSLGFEEAGRWAVLYVARNSS